MEAQQASLDIQGAITLFTTALAHHIKPYPREMLEAASESLTSQCPLALHTLEFPSKRPKHRTHSRSPMDSVAGNWHVRHARRSELK